MVHYFLAVAIMLSLELSAQSETRQKLYFDNGKYELSAQQMLSLRESMDGLSANQKVIILGYASKSGEESKNMELSKKRAETIGDFLTSNGVSAARVELRHFGDAFAEKVNEKEWRRAEFIITTDEKENENIFKPVDNSEVFIIDGTMDTTIVCKKGTKIFIKAGTLVNTITADPAEKITIKVDEYLSTLDFLEKGLSTRSDGRPLISGGMLNIEASENNQTLAVRKGKNVKLSMPCNDCGPGMTTFYGDKQKETINWRTTSEKQGKIVSRKTLPVFAEGQESLKHFIQQNRKYPTKAFSKGVEGVVKIKFLINESGKVLEAKLDKSIEASLDKEAIRLVELMPRWTPAKLDGVPIDYIYTIPIEFKITREPFGKYNITSIGGDMSDYTVDKETDSIQKERENQEAKAKREEMQAVVDFGYYVITSSQLGWINCDRFDRSQLTNFIVDANTIDFVKVYLIMKNQKSLFRDEYRTNSKFNFRQIGLNQEVYVLTIKSIESKMYMSLLEANTAQQAVLVSNYKEATLQEIKQTVAALHMK